MDDYNLLPEHITKNLQDKSQEKREQGGRELSKLIDTIKQEEPIRNIAKIFKDRFIQSQQYQQRKAGLHALYSIAHSISKNETLAKACLEDVIQPMLDCFKDKEERVRYAGIEYLFLTCKAMNDIILLKFDDIYKKLLQNLLDTDEQVKKAAQQLDNQLKSLVTSTAPEKQYFKIQSFIPIISQKMNSNNQIKCNLISWISTLNSIPYIELFDYIAQFLKELFLILSESQMKDPFAQDAKTQAKRQLEEFQRDIERYSHRHTFNQQQELKTHRQIIDTLISVIMSCNMDSNVLFQVLNWIQEYLRIVNEELDEGESEGIPMELSGGQIIKGINLMQHSIFEEKRESILQQVIMENLNGLLKQVLGLLSHENPMINQQAQIVNELMLSMMDKLKQSNKEFVDIMPTIQDMLKEKNSRTAEQALLWMRHLLQTQAEKLKPMIENILENLIDRLKDAEKEVIENVMDVLKSMSNEQYFDMVIEKILQIFEKNIKNASQKNELIIKKLCTIWNPSLVYTTICTKLLQKYVYVEEDDIDLNFASKVVQLLEYLLIVDDSLKDVRYKLKTYKYEKNSNVAKKTNDFFQNIYRTFCFNPVSALSLSLLAEEYELTYNIILNLAENEANIETLVQIAKLIILLESPQFAYLRLQLLEASKYPYLLQSLEGLMMILPQTPIQNQLKQRLKYVDIFYEMDKVSQQREIINKLDTQMLLKIFSGIRKEEKTFRKLSNDDY